MTATRRYAAGSAVSLILLASTATVVFAFLPRISGAHPLADIGFLVVPGVFSAVGFLVATRRPGNSVGWLLLTVGLLFTIVAASSAATRYLHGDGQVEWARVTDRVGALWVPALGIAGTHLLLRLPSGALPSRRWRWYSPACTAVIAVTFFLVVGPSRNPFGPLFVLFPLAFVGSVGSVVIRYRCATGLERLQLRWIALGGGVFLAAYLPNLLEIFGGVRDGSTLASAIQTISFLAFSAIPVAIGIAVLRFRLYEIDRILSGAAVYGTLTATLAATYLVCILILQIALSGLTQDSGLAVAGSTLAVAALFRPARARIQHAVDRRFYRARYDARRTVDSFVTKLRDEVDITALDTELRGVVAQTFQPAHVSLWMLEQR